MGGGFGVYQLIGHDPGLFDLAIPVAGYVQGTCEPESRGYRAPQPQAYHIFNDFLHLYASRMAEVPAILVVHAQDDSESSYLDAEIIVKRVKAHGGNAMLLTVPRDQADSDLGKKKKAKTNGHRYFNFSLLDDTAEHFLWKRARDILFLRDREYHFLGAELAKSREGATSSRAPSLEVVSIGDGHPSCISGEDCIGTAASPLYQHIREGKPAVLYCDECRTQKTGRTMMVFQKVGRVSE